MALKARKAMDPDLPTTREALSGPCAEQFWEAMDKEIQSFEGKGTWNVVDRSEVPPGMKVTPGTFVQKDQKAS